MGAWGQMRWGLGAGPDEGHGRYRGQIGGSRKGGWGTLARWGWESSGQMGQGLRAWEPDGESDPRREWGKTEQRTDESGARWRQGGQMGAWSDGSGARWGVEGGTRWEGQTGGQIGG